MDAIVLTIGIFMAVLVMASGLWVATVLIATVARLRRPATSPKNPAVKEADP
jgi:hypothetical protein